MKHPRDWQVGIDSQCLSYLLDAIASASEPTDQLAEERKALVRSWLYRYGTYIVSETVIAEVRAIREAARRDFHIGFIRSLFADLPTPNKQEVDARSRLFNALHSGLEDCRILAEAETLKLDAVLTYDTNFLKRLRHASDNTKLLAPSEYWHVLNVSRGTSPVTVPHHTNPFAAQSWWLDLAPEFRTPA